MSSSKLRVNKNIKYSKDLSSHEIWKVLISLLYEAAAPLSVYGNMSIETAMSCLALSTDNRRKISDRKSDKFLEDIFYELTLRVGDEDDVEQSKLALLEFILNKGVERNIIVDHIAYSLALTRFPKNIDSKKLRNFVDQYLEDYDTFKQDLVYRYYHVTEAYANKNYYAKKASGLHSSKSDMFHVYLISAMRAIDRFIPTKGPLTTDIENWFQNARGSSDYIVYDGEAISINRAVRRSLHEGNKVLNTKSIPLEDRENTLTDEAHGEDSFYNTYTEYSRHVAKLSNSTILFLALNIKYSLDAEQISRINKANKHALLRGCTT